MMLKNKLGVYRVGDLEFHSKLEAILVMQKTGKHLHWDFNENIFNTYDWASEPEDSLPSLYRERAQQLRDKYDYVILWYSGGADSNNVLDTFFDNDIKLDEVASYHNYSGARNWTNNVNSEIAQVAIPKIKKIQESWPWLKHTLFDYCDYTMDFFKSQKNKFDWIYTKNHAYVANSGWRDQVGLKVKAWADLINQGKKVCFIWAHEKPRVMFVNGRWVFRFIDLIDNGPTVDSFSGNNPYDDELFYWSPDLPELIIKQAHLVKNYLANTTENNPFLMTDLKGTCRTTINGKTYELSNHGLHNIIYHTWDINTFSVGKTPSIIMNDKDLWFYNLSQTDPALTTWRNGVDYVFKTIPDFWKNDPADFLRGVKCSWSKDYFLEKERK